jgi:PAS domain-containing protein
MFGRFQSSVSLVSEATLILDHSGIIRYLDANVAKIFGYEVDRLVGRRFCRLLATPYDTHYGVLLANIAAYHHASSHAGLSSYVSPLQPGASRIVEAMAADAETFLVSLSITELLDNNILSFIVLIERIPRPKGIITVCKSECVYAFVVFCRVAFLLVKFVRYDTNQKKI